MITRQRREFKTQALKAPNVIAWAKKRDISHDISRFKELLRTPTWGVAPGCYISRRWHFTNDASSAISFLFS
ncbi:MAG TPA: hypothetical protein VGW76_04380, partial [Pyrinomonadaceae bacterium]|nr:hypothetical protein [Pyrinomonadaceae bacterium]